jgi:transcriptional regulator with XRE-family HTH domain
MLATIDGKRAKEIRECLHYTQGEFALKLGYKGGDQSICRVERLPMKQVSYKFYRGLKKLSEKEKIMAGIEL